MIIKRLYSNNFKRYNAQFNTAFTKQDLNKLDQAITEIQLCARYGNNTKFIKSRIREKAPIHSIVYGGATNLIMQFNTVDFGKDWFTLNIVQCTICHKTEALIFIPHDDTQYDINNFVQTLTRHISYNGITFFDSTTGSHIEKLLKPIS